MPNIINTLKNAATQCALQELKDRLLNPAVASIGRIKEISYRDLKLFLVVELAGLEGQPVEISSGLITIADDGSYIQFGEFDSNMLFAKNALDMFATTKFAVPDKRLVRTVLVTAKKILGL